MRHTTYIRQLATLQRERSNSNKPAAYRGLLLLFPHAELDVVVTPEGGGGAGEAGRREAARRSREAASTGEGRKVG